MNVRWWRVGLLALITVASGWASFASFTSSGPPDAATDVPRARRVSAPLPYGPVPGDLRTLMSYADPWATPTPEPTAAPVRRRSSGSSSTTKRSAPEAPSRPFDDLPGAGVLGDLCGGGRC